MLSSCYTWARAQFMKMKSGYIYMYIWHLNFMCQQWKYGAPDGFCILCSLATVLQSSIIGTVHLLYYDCWDL